LAARAQRALVQRMRRIALQLDRPAVPHLGDDSAARRTLAAGGGVVVGDSRYGIVRAVQVGYELLYPIGAAPHGAGGDAGSSKNVQEVATLDDRGSRRCAHVRSNSESASVTLRSSSGVGGVRTVKEGTTVSSGRWRSRNAPRARHGS